MIAARYAWPAAGLLLLALVPTARNVYRAPESLAAGSLARAIPERIEPFGRAEPGDRRAPWVEKVFGAADFVTRRYRALDLFAARTYDGKKLFHYPELALTYGRAARSVTSDTVELEVGPLPVKTLRFAGGHVSAYALFYGRRPVRDPVRFLLGVLPERFVGKREPMTLLYVQGASQEEVAALLAAASEAFLRP